MGVKEYLEEVIDKDPDIFLISEDGEHVGTHRILLRLFLPVFRDCINYQEEISHISVPASGPVLKHFLSALCTGVAIATDVEELRAVSDLSRSFGLWSADWQIGLGRSKKKKVVDNKELENETSKDLEFEEKEDENIFENNKNIKILPYQNTNIKIELEKESAKDFVFDGKGEKENMFEDTMNIKALPLQSKGIKRNKQFRKSH